MTTAVDISSQLNTINSNTDQVNYTQNQKNLGSQSIGNDGFLQLLLAQLKYQDPTNPTDDQQFVSQEAQFTQINKLDDINTTLTQSGQFSQAGSLVGKQVSLTDSNGNTVQGPVTSAVIDSTGVNVKVNNTIYPASSITQVSNSSSSTTDGTSGTSGGV